MHAPGRKEGGLEEPGKPVEGALQKPAVDVEVVDGVLGVGVGVAAPCRVRFVLHTLCVCFGGVMVV